MRKQQITRLHFVTIFLLLLQDNNPWLTFNWIQTAINLWQAHCLPQRRVNKRSLPSWKDEFQYNSLIFVRDRHSSISTMELYPTTQISKTILVNRESLVGCLLLPSTTHYRWLNLSNNRRYSMKISFRVGKK